MKLSLHNHSNYSDGLYSVESIMQKASELGLDVISITDHNEIRGSLKAFRLSDKYKIRVLPGVELFFWYQGKITELLVYFRKPTEIIGFYNEFLGAKFIPKVKSPEELYTLVEKYNGLAVMPHPLAQKGCLRNGFNYPTENIETINPMVGEYKLNSKNRNFGGGDLHFYLNSLKSYSELVNGKFIDDLFNQALPVTAHSDFKLSSLNRWWQRIMIIPLDIKYLLMQIIRKKLLKKGYLKP